MQKLSILLGVSIVIAVLATRGFADPPRVSITYPTPNTTLDAALTPTIILQASTTDPDESIIGVGYYACVASGSTCGGTPFQAGATFSSPFQLIWALPNPLVLTQNGATVQFLVWASADNSVGQASQTSASVPFTVIYPPGLPNVSLIEPEPGNDFIVPASPVLYATASPGPAGAGVQSTIVRVDFLDNGEQIGSVAAPNVVPSAYAFVWTNPELGVHFVSARATDSLGNASTSLPATIYVLDSDDPPEVNLTLPTTGQLFAPGAVVSLAATASSPQGMIERVDFIEGQNLIGSSRTAPFSAAWTAPPAGNFTIVALAYDDLGVVTASRPAYISVLGTPRMPSVVLTAPAPGSTVSGSVPLPLAASALSPDGSIAHVDFFVGSTLLGTSTSAPYTASWTIPQIGARSLTAKAYDLQGFSATSAAVPITVTSSLVPSIAVTVPSSGASFNTPATLTVTAAASEAGGSIAKVDFYANSNLIGTKNSSPYTITWNNPLVGGYTLLAKATDAVGTVATSAGVPITVVPPVPTITLTAPSPGARYSQSRTIAIAAQASTPQSAISKVEFDSDGIAIGSINAPTGTSSGTFTLNWSGLPQGTHAITAKVFSTSGSAATSSAINVTIVNLTASLSAPVGGQDFQSPEPIQITANASATPGTIAHVDFFGDGNLIGTSTVAPYRAVWNNVAVGLHTLTATAYDATGLSLSATAVPISVIAQPTVQITAGLDGSSVADDNVGVTGTVAAPINSAVVVNGQPASLGIDGTFFVDGLQLQPGSNTLTLVLNTQDSAPIVKTITVTSTAASAFQATLDRQEGFAPLTVNLTLRNRGNTPFKRIEIDSRDIGVSDVVLTGLPSDGQTVAFAYPNPGSYTMRIKVFDNNENVIYTAVRHIRAIDPADVIRKVGSVYTTIVNRLSVGDSNGALNGFAWESRPKYQAIFTALGASIPTIAPKLGDVIGITVFDSFAELAIARSPANGGQSFLVNLYQGADGIWRVEGM